MWLLVLFDLPTGNGRQRRKYEEFRGTLLRDGFEMVQKSVYLRWEQSAEATRTLTRQIMARAPSEGKVVIFSMTAADWARSHHLVDGECVSPPSHPTSFVVF